MLNEKELNILRLLINDKTEMKISKELFISKSTIKVYVKNIFAELGVKNSEQAKIKAISENLI